MDSLKKKTLYSYVPMNYCHHLFLL